jgi:hypothetical protein
MQMVITGINSLRGQNSGLTMTVELFRMPRRDGKDPTEQVHTRGRASGLNREMSVSNNCWY